MFCKNAKKNIQLGSHPILLIPKDQEQRARFLAQEENLHEAITIIAIEDFLALNIIELAAQENKDFFGVLREIIQIYNDRLSAVETDMSLQIELH